MAASLNPPATPPGTPTGHTTSPVEGLERMTLTTCKASNILLRLPGELHSQISSYMDKDLVSITLPVASNDCTSNILLPYYIPRLSDEKQRLLTIALLTGFPISSLCWILDVLVFGVETEHAEVLHSSDMFASLEEHWRGRDLPAWRIINPADWHNDASADRVGILNAAAALGKVEVLQALFGRIISWMDVAELDQGLLTRYPTPILYACLYAQPHAVRWLTDWYTQHAPAALDVIFSDNLSSPSADYWRCTPFCLAMVGLRYPGRTEEDVLSVLNVLESYPAVGVLPGEADVPWMTMLYQASVVLPAPILRVLLRRMPFSADQLATGGGFIGSMASKPTPYSLGCIQVLLDAGVRLPEDCWVRFIMGGNPQLFSWMAQNVPGFLQQRQWPNFLALMEVLVSISQRLSPRGFAGDQTLCFAILSSEAVTATPNAHYHSDDRGVSVATPRQYFRPFFDALVRAGADVDGLWVDGKPRDTRWDTPRMASYRNWTARQLMEEIRWTGSL
ncbi:hypothetical protein FN846DRAFT_891147 [Sphaerosporella brunnea]|uniref:Uncharacterized protein n=1 Tax=Sphaerosporella brunnea TaxID=1250544 RepID=A0A5J5EV56_9PEZI|nr:hypothetical protein FN846DRAFT_891147 [Sphaerosporella brunnea]